MESLIKGVCNTNRFPSLEAIVRETKRILISTVLNIVYLINTIAHRHSRYPIFPSNS